MKLLCLCCCYLNLWFNTLLFVQIPFQISKPYYLRLFIVYISMDSTDRANMVTRVNEALGIADVVDYPQTAAERIREAFVNRPRRSLAQGPSMNELIAMSLARGTAQAESITFWCHVLILRVISGKPWYYFSCALCQCKKGVTKIGNVFMCSSCEDVCSVPIPRYKLQLEVTNGISTVMVTLFDEVAERLIKKLAHDLLSDWTIDHDPFALPSEISCLQRKFHVMELKSNTYYDHGTYESFACSAIIKPILGMKSVTFACKVLIKKIRPDTTWCYLACDACKSNEGISDVGGAYWCGVCASICEVPTIRYRLEMDVTNGKSSIVVIFNNTEAEGLVKQPARQLLPHFQAACDFYQIPPEIINLSNTYHFLEFKTHTYIDHDEYESFVCNRVLSPRPSLKLGIISLPKRTLPYTELEAAQILPYYRNGDPNTLNHVFVSAAKGSGKQKRNINESSKEE